MLLLLNVEKFLSSSEAIRYVVSLLRSWRRLKSRKHGFNIHSASIISHCLLMRYHGMRMAGCED